MTASARRRAWLLAVSLTGALVMGAVAARHQAPSEAAETPSSSSPAFDSARLPARKREALRPAELSNAPPAAPTAPREPDEAELMGALRSSGRSDPGFVVALAREGNRRFPNSSDAAERTSLLIHALAEQGLSSEARGEAEDMVNRYPDSRWVREIESFTGAHRHRNLRVDEEGRLHYVDPPPST